MDFQDMKAVLAMILIQLVLGGMNILSEIALEQGMDHYVFVAYRQIAAVIVLAPLAYMKERRDRPALTLKISIHIFLLAFFGITVAQNFFYIGMSYTGSTFTSAMSNLIPVFTFVLSAVLGLEKVNWRIMRGKAKVIGTLVCVGGAMIMTFYKGPPITILKIASHLSLNKYVFLGSASILGAVVFWAGWLALQTYVIKSYPVLLSFTALQCGFGGLQSAILALIFKGTSSDLWSLGWNMKLAVYIYSGVLGTALNCFVTSWAVQQRGSVFVAVFLPLSTVFTAVLECTLLAYSLHVGSVIGATVIILGLYFVLWGKAKKQQAIKNLDMPSENGSHSDSTQPLLLGIDTPPSSVRNGVK